jgi:hypothetical protein
MLVCGTFFLAFAVWLVLAGESGALVFVLAGAGLIVIVAWPWRSPTAYPVHEWIGMGLVSGGLAAAGTPLLAATLFPAAFLLMLGSALWLRRTFRRAGSFDFEVVGAAEVMPGAEAAVAAFEAVGFTRAGGYAFSMRPGAKRIVGTVLVAPSGDRYAVVTDRVVELSSRFAGDHWLLTANRGNLPLPGDILRQVVARGLPAKLMRVHETAVELLAGRGVRPDRFTADDGLVEVAVDSEKRAVRYAAETGWRQTLAMEPRGKRRHPVLSDDKKSRKRIDAWLAAGA